jgi:hypothetical protein
VGETCILISIACRLTIEMKTTFYSIIITVVRRRTIEMKMPYKMRKQIILISIVRRLTIEMKRNEHKAKVITYVSIVLVPVVRVPSVWMVSSEENNHPTPVHRWFLRREWSIHHHRLYED